MEDFESKVRKIFYYIAEFGVTKMPFYKLGRLPTEQEKKKFKGLVHFGFRLGQNIILKEMVAMHELQVQLNKELQRCNQIKDINEKRKVKAKLFELKYNMYVLRHFADFIAWQIIGGHHYKARTLFSGKRTRPDLLNTNLDSVIYSIRQFHLRDPMSFGLITDLTTFIDVGDIIWVDYESIKIVEVKSGEKQKTVNVLVDKILNIDHEFKKEDFEGITKSMWAQTERTINQLMKGIRARNILNNDKGPDPFTGEIRTIIEHSVPEERYYQKLVELMDKAIKQGVASGNIDGIIKIGVYQATDLPDFFDFEDSSYIIQENKIITDYSTQLFIPIAEPLFFKPIGKEHLFNILFGKLKVVLTIDLDELIDFFNKGGLQAEWMSSKETHKHKEKLQRKHKPFVFKNRAIQIKTEYFSLILGDQFLIKLFFDNVTPTSMLNTYLQLRPGKNVEYGSDKK